MRKDKFYPLKNHRILIILAPLRRQMCSEGFDLENIRIQQVSKVCSSVYILSLHNKYIKQNLFCETEFLTKKKLKVASFAGRCMWNWGKATMWTKGENRKGRMRAVTFVEPWKENWKIISWGVGQTQILLFVCTKCHGMSWVGKNPKDDLAPTPIPWAGTHLPLDQVAQSPIHTCV